MRGRVIFAESPKADRNRGELTDNILQISLAPKAVSDGGETNKEKISKQADLLAEQVPTPFSIKVSACKICEAHRM